MKRLITLALTGMMGMVLLASNGSAMTLKIATLSPEGSMWMEKFREGAKEVEAKTEGRVSFKYYPGGVMGDDKAVIRKMRIGQLHGGAVVSGSLAQFYPDSLVYGLPLIFKSLEEVDYVRERMDPVILKGYEDNGVVAFGMAEGGFAYVMSNAPVQTTEDVKRQKVWIPDSDNFLLRTVEVFDIKPIPLSIADVRAGLQTGLVDTVTTSPIGAVTLQWHTQVEYLMDLPLLYIYAVFAVDKKAFSRISPEDRNIVREVMGRIFREVDRRNREDNGNALEALQNQGVKFIRPSPEAVDEWMKKAAEVPRRLIDSGELSQEIYDVLMGHLSDFRSKNAGADGTKP